MPEELDALRENLLRSLAEIAESDPAEDFNPIETEFIRQVREDAAK